MQQVRNIMNSAATRLSPARVGAENLAQNISIVLGKGRSLLASTESLPRARWAIFVVLTGLLSVSALEATTRGLGWLYYYPAKISFEKQRNPGAKPTSPGTELIQLTSQSLALDPHNPDTLKLRARLIDHINDNEMADLTAWQSFDLQLLTGLQPPLMRIQQALQVRPSSPWLWSYIALYKAKLGQVDKLMQQGLHQSTLLGPHSPNVQLLVAETGLWAWPELQPEIQAVLLEQIERGLPRTGPAIMASARKFDQVEMLCAQTRIHAKAGRHCEQVNK